MTQNNDDSKNKFKVGKDSVVIGNINNNSYIGDNSVVIGLTDAHDNVILNTNMAIGRGAFAGSNSIAIGAGAGAGASSETGVVLHQISLILEKTNDPALINLLALFRNELNKPAPDKTLLNKLWDGIKAAGTFNDAIGLTDKIAAVIAAL